MNKLLTTLLLTFPGASLLAQDLQNPHEQSIPKVETYSYGKFGSSILMQNFGFGQRTRNIEGCYGKDLSLNANISIPVAMSGVMIAYPSFKYTMLSYNNHLPNSGYFGLGCEAGVLILGESLRKSYLPIPNLELVWGKERESRGFGQLGVNLVPLAGAITSFANVNDAKGYDGILYFLVGSVATLSIVTYTVSF